MDYVKTNNSKKDCLMGRDVIKKAEDIIITEDGMRVKDLVKGYLALEAEYLKTKEENLKLSVLTQKDIMHTLLVFVILVD